MVSDNDRNQLDLDTDMEDEPVAIEEQPESQEPDDSTIAFLGHTGNNSFQINQDQIQYIVFPSIKQAKSLLLAEVTTKH